MSNCSLDEGYKAPEETKDFTFDWSQELLDDNIRAGGSTWAVTGPDGTLTVGETSISNSMLYATAWLSGGTAGQIYTVTNHIQTAGGRYLSRSFICFVNQYNI